MARVAAPNIFFAIALPRIALSAATTREAEDEKTDV
jgi:hypothetical protein